MKATLLIVDDEPHARRYIHNLLTKDHEIEVLGECKNGREVLAFIEKKKPDIILLDIQMPGINGIEVAQKLKSINSIVIFTTAYDQYALKAFEVEALNYLLKPFDENRFYEALNKAKYIIQLKQQANFSEKIINVFDDYKVANSLYLTQLIIKEKGIERVIKTNDIEFFEARSVYIMIYTKNDVVLYRATLNLLEQQLSNDFLRIHRSYIINTQHIKRYKYLNNNTYAFMMTNDKEVISSRSYKTSIQKVLSK